MGSRSAAATIACLFVTLSLTAAPVAASAMATGGADATAGAGFDAGPPAGTLAQESPESDDGASEPLDAETIDELIETAMDDHDIAGGSAAVVEGDEVVHTEGYGDANVETGESVDPNETSFMIGSVAKLFVWSAVMAGVEDGTLDLEEPIGTYLEDYEFEGDDEITLADLGTHTPGYEDRLEGVFVADPEDAESWEKKLEREMPAQVREPGETVAYSNHGTVLAALVVQEAYDEPFERHVEERFFEPLGMDGATFEQPVPDDRATVSQGHVYTGTEFESADPATIGVPPAGSMTATSADMASFAAAMLQSGAFENERVLEAESVEAMFDERATNHPDVHGVGYGYFLGERGGEEIVWHTGGTEYFTTLFVLFPAHDVGLFVSFNTPSDALPDVLDAFVAERFDSATPLETNGDELEPDPATAERAEAYEGEYRTTAFETTYEKLVGLGESVTVSVADDGTVELEHPLGFGDTTRWVEVEPGVFEPHPDEDELGFTTSLALDGDTLYMDAPAAPYEELSWYETTTAQAGFAVTALAILLSTLVVWPINAYRNRGWGRMRGYLTRARLAILACVGLLIVFVTSVLTNVVLDPNQIVYGLSPWLRLTLGLAPVFAAAALAAVAFVGAEWYRTLGTDNSKSGANGYALGYLLALLLALFVLVWQLWYWNILTAAL